MSCTRHVTRNCPADQEGTFDKYIFERRVEAVVQHAKAGQNQDFTLDDDGMTPWYRGPYYCGHIVPRATPMWQNYWLRAVGEFIPTIIDNFIDLQRPLSSDIRQRLRARYARDVCNALRALGQRYFIKLLSKWTEIEYRRVDQMLLAVAAATGDKKLFQYLIRHVDDVWQAHGHYFPNTLDAAIAAGQTDMVNAILNYVLDEVKRLAGWFGRQSVKKIGSGLLQSLRLAVRLEYTDIAHTIFEVLKSKRKINDSVNPPLHNTELLLRPGAGVKSR